jgi:hypothetical protein
MQSGRGHAWASWSGAGPGVPARARPCTAGSRGVIGGLPPFTAADLRPRWPQGRLEHRGGRVQSSVTQSGAFDRFRHSGSGGSGSRPGVPAPRPAQQRDTGARAQPARWHRDRLRPDRLHRRRWQAALPGRGTAMLCQRRRWAAGPRSGTAAAGPGDVDRRAELVHESARAAANRFSRIPSAGAAGATWRPRGGNCIRNAPRARGISCAPGFLARIPGTGHSWLAAQDRALSWSRSGRNTLAWVVTSATTSRKKRPDTR